MNLKIPSPRPATLPRDDIEGKFSVSKSLPATPIGAGKEKLSIYGRSASPSVSKIDSPSKQRGLPPLPPTPTNAATKNSVAMSLTSLVPAAASLSPPPQSPGSSSPSSWKRLSEKRRALSLKRAQLEQRISKAVVGSPRMSEDCSRSSNRKIGSQKITTFDPLLVTTLGEGDDSQSTSSTSSASVNSSASDGSHRPEQNNENDGDPLQDNLGNASGGPSLSSFLDRTLQSPLSANVKSSGDALVMMDSVSNRTFVTRNGQQSFLYSGPVVQDPENPLTVVPHGNTCTLRFENGCVYTGCVQYGQRQGYGKQTWPSKSRPKKKSRSFSRQKAMPAASDSSPKMIYVGMWDNDVRHGKGKQSWPATGKVVMGSWVNGELQGKICMTTADVATDTDEDPQITSQYDGMCVNGKQHGRGIHTWYTKTETSTTTKVYNGDYNMGRKQGRGILTVEEESTPDVSDDNEPPPTTLRVKTYRGDFHENQKHGHGIEKKSTTQNDGATTISSTLYDGEWSGSQYHGYGKLVSYDAHNPAACFTYAGDFCQGQFHGDGCYKQDGTASKQSTTIVGNFVHGYLQGTGMEYSYSNTGGSTYQGNFVDSQKEGYGCWKINEKTGAKKVVKAYYGHWHRNERGHGLGIHVVFVTDEETGETASTVQHIGWWHKNAPLVDTVNGEKVERTKDHLHMTYTYGRLTT